MLGIYLDAECSITQMLSMRVQGSDVTRPCISPCNTAPCAAQGQAHHITITLNTHTHVPVLVVVGGATLDRDVKCLVISSNKTLALVPCVQCIV